MAYISKIFPRDINNLIVNKYLDDLDRFVLLRACGVWNLTVSHRSNIMYIVAEKGYLKVLKWLETICPHIEDFGDLIVMIASSYGHIDILKRYQRFATPGNVIMQASQRGQLGVLQWFDETNDFRDWKYQEHSFGIAAKNGHLEIMTWLREKRCSYGGRVFQNALEGGHIHVLEWLYNINSGFSRFGGASAALYGNLKVLQWMQSKGILCDKGECLSIAIENGYTEIVDWLTSVNLPISVVTKTDIFN